MSDILADRFLAITDLADDGDWLEVKRRAAHPVRRRWVVGGTAAVAVVLAAVAVAATNGWIFKRAPYAEPTFAKTFAFQGASWSIVGALDGNGALSCFDVGRTEAVLAARGRCRVFLVTPPGGSPFSRSGPLTMLRWPHRGGEIWFGETRSTVARVEITDSRGRTVAAPTVAAPTLPYPTAHYRLWLIPLPSSLAVSVAAYDRRGKLLYRGAPPGAAVYLHQ